MSNPFDRPKWTHCVECERELESVRGGAFCSKCYDEQADEIERLRADLARLEHLLSDALAHTPDSYCQPIMAILKRKAAQGAGGNDE